MSSYSDDLKQLVGDSGLVLFSRVVGMGGAFIAHTLLVRTLQPDTFGILSLALTVISVAAGVAAFGMNEAVARFISTSESGKENDYIIVGFSIILISGPLLMSLVIIFQGGLESVFSAPGLGGLLWALGILIVIRPIGGLGPC